MPLISMQFVADPALRGCAVSTVPDAHLRLDAVTGAVRDAVATADASITSITLVVADL